jgi:hypothetical protein
MGGRQRDGARLVAAERRRRSNMMGVPMETAVSPQEAVSRADEAAIPLVPQDEKDTQDALTKLAEEAARATAKLRPASVANFSAGPRVAAPTVEPVHAPRADDHVVAMPMSPSRNSGRSLSGFLFAVGIGVAATLAWQSYGQAARQMIAVYVPALAGASAPAVETMSTGAGHEPDRGVVQSDADATSAHAPVSVTTAPVPPSPELAQQIETMARDLAALRDGMVKVSTAQDQMNRSIAKLQEADEEAHRKVTPPPRPAPARRPAAAPPRPLAPPVAQTPPRSAAQSVSSTPLPLASPPPVTPPPEPPRRPPASMP